ncbi:hypothetical protein [Methylorubrum thiocyanatum]
MPLPNRATNAANRDAHPILFGLLADGSGEARFTQSGGTPLDPVRASPDALHFSPSRDWYGRWDVRPLHGTLMQDAERMDGSVCPDDIVVLRPRRPARRA